MERTFAVDELPTSGPNGLFGVRKFEVVRVHEMQWIPFGGQDLEATFHSVVAVATGLFEGDVVI